MGSYSFQCWAKAEHGYISAFSTVFTQVSRAGNLSGWRSCLCECCSWYLFFFVFLNFVCFFRFEWGTCYSCCNKYIQWVVDQARTQYIFYLFYQYSCLSRHEKTPTVVSGIMISPVFQKLKKKPHQYKLSFLAPTSNFFYVCYGGLFWICGTKHDSNINGRN